MPFGLLSPGTFEEPEAHVAGTGTLGPKMESALPIGLARRSACFQRAAYDASSTCIVICIVDAHPEMRRYHDDAEIA